MERFVEADPASHGGPAARPDVTGAELSGIYLAGDWVGPTAMLPDASLATPRRARRRLTGARASRTLIAVIATAASSSFEEHAAFLDALGYRMLGSAADAEDLVQDTFVRLLEHPPPEANDSLRPWLPSPLPSPGHAPRILIRVEPDADGCTAEIHSILAPDKLLALDARPVR